MSPHQRSPYTVASLRNATLICKKEEILQPRRVKTVFSDLNNALTMLVSIIRAFYYHKMKMETEDHAK